MVPRQPWFRAGRNAWYVEIDGKQVKLATGKDNEEKAWREYHRRMAARADKEELVEKASGRPLREVCNLFLAHAEKHVEARSFDFYKRYLQSFSQLHGDVRVSELRPLHLTEWLNAHPGWKASRRHAIIAVKRCFKWAHEEGVADRNPFLGVKKPAVGRRDRILTAAEKEEILAAIRDRQFREFVFALYETGCRPSEVARVTAAHFRTVQDKSGAECHLWVFEEHKTKKKTGKARIIYLTPPMVELTKALVAKHPEGPLFRGNRNHKGFSRNGIRCRFRRLREKLPHLKGVVSYTARHTYATEALANGVAAIELAELLGHADTKMIESHYAHLDQKTEHMLKAAKRARAS
jgi:integrase